ncbi:ankyrin repeat domain-containing protein SOWAHC-like [Clupea harengus]|uniref:Ankyrin repeat domain-containing protein SOWAHC-like n=1 Tax=Clupea harengus TaxID=7950 RepID=A0A6P3WE21_CLUHA|nr:ankyrin repeat domain-containing protein SOWAHC-like [Clupea harengus]
MATDCTQETVLRFLMERGGTVKNLDLIDHFRAVLSTDPIKKAMMKDAFKMYVDSVAFVKVENGTKYVCLKKKYRGSMRQEENVPAYGDSDNNERSEHTVINCEHVGDAFSEQLPDSLPHNMPQITLNDTAKAVKLSLESAGNDDAKQELPPGSGYSDENGREVERSGVRDSTSGGVNASSALLVPEANNLSKMGNKSSCSPENKVDGSSEESLQMSDQTIPKIAVIEASPLPAASDGTMFSLPQPVGLPQPDQTLSEANAFKDRNNSKKYSQNGQEQDKSYEEDNSSVTKGVLRRRSRGSQRSVGSNISDGSDEVHFDTTSMSGSDTNTPRGSRKNFIELMMNSSPQVRRSMVLRNSVYLSARHKDSRSDSDSIVSSNTDDENTPVSLDPMEHEWMMCASDGEWESLHRLLACEPNLVLKKDFVTGFTCLHWAAKLGKQELLALLVNFAKKHAVPVNINSRSSAGYTPLHLAAMHNHVEVVKLLVGAYEADVEVRDYSGKKACQYLPKSVADEVYDISGGHGNSDLENVDYGEPSRWRLSKVLQSNLRPLKLLNHSEEEVCEGASPGKSKLLRRKSSLSKMKPKLHKIRFRTQIVHSASFNDRELSEARHKSPPRSRPMSSLFG